MIKDLEGEVVVLEALLKERERDLYITLGLVYAIRCLVPLSQRKDVLTFWLAIQM
jgi:hypothetical protein